ncbi:Nif3-like dinuclear metal center hexameric protein, partial [Escherichia coli]|uniref:Nif3-like dinuclear metal center hexameric protein n=1 Tax=Escherichia coli TaxID=562 RepID=UPI002076D5A0
EMVQKIVTGVTASQALLDEAVRLGADAVIVHHGYFWKGESPVFSDKNLPSFSISYAGNMVGVALTTEGECGLDMELQRATRG